MSFLRRLLAIKFVLVTLLLALGTSSLAAAQADEVTFHKDIEPILQRSCQNCHRDGGVGPMPLVTYDQVAPFAGLIEYKTGLRDRAGAMPPWYMEKNIGIRFQQLTNIRLRESSLQLSGQRASLLLQPILRLK